MSLNKFLSQIAAILLLAFYQACLFAGEPDKQRAGESAQSMLVHLTCLATAKISNPIAQYDADYSSYDIDEEKLEDKTRFQFGSQANISICGDITVSNQETVKSLENMRPALDQVVNEIIAGKPADSIDTSYFEAAMDNYIDNDGETISRLNISPHSAPEIIKNNQVALAYAKLARNRHSNDKEEATFIDQLISQSNAAGFNNLASKNSQTKNNATHNYQSNGKPRGSGTINLSTTGVVGNTSTGHNSYAQKSGSSSASSNSYPESNQEAPGKIPNSDSKSKSDPYSFPEHEIDRTKIIPDSYPQQARDREINDWGEKYKDYFTKMSGVSPARPLSRGAIFDCHVGSQDFCQQSSDFYDKSLEKVKNKIDEARDKIISKPIYEKEEKNWLAEHPYFCAWVPDSPICKSIN